MRWYAWVTCRESRKLSILVRSVNRSTWLKALLALPCGLLHQKCQWQLMTTIQLQFLYDSFNDKLWYTWCKDGKAISSSITWIMPSDVDYLFVNFDVENRRLLNQVMYMPCLLKYTCTQKSTSHWARQLDARKFLLKVLWSCINRRRREDAIGTPPIDGYVTTSSFFAGHRIH